MPDSRDALRAIAPWLTIAVLVIVLDQVTKGWVLAQSGTLFADGGRVEVTFFFDLVLAFNSGAAFSFLAGHSGWQRWFFIVLALIICTWLSALIWQHRRERLMPFALSLVIGGALGNAIDRVIYGKVVDFLSFHANLPYAGPSYWPAFNLADSAIILGVGLMLISQFRAKKNPPEILT
jgi:signal peptidase II